MRGGLIDSKFLTWAESEVLLKRTVNAWPRAKPQSCKMTDLVDRNNLRTHQSDTFEQARFLTRESVE